MDLEDFNVKIVIMDGSAANPGDINWKPFEEIGEVVAYDVTLPSQIIERASDAEIVITNKTPFTRETIEALPSLKYIGVLATGFNVIDLQAASDHGIVVTNVPEYGTYATMQHTIALMLELTNHVAIHSQSVMDGDWVKSPQFCYWNKPLMELWGKTIVVVGYGKIGARVCETAKALGMNVIAVPHHIPHENVEGITFEKFEDAAPKADIISLHAPLTDETKGLINATTINNLKDGVLIINAARGPMVVEKDIADALASGKIGGFACDVVSVEPMSKDNPLLGAPNCIITPHIAWAPKETRERLVVVAANNIKAFLKGENVNQVN